MSGPLVLGIETSCDETAVAVVEGLEREKMITTPAPLPNRKQEVRDLSRKLGLPE